MQVAIKWITIHEHYAPNGAPTTEENRRSVIAENQFVRRITYSLLQPLSQQETNEAFSHLVRPEGVRPAEANVVQGYNICGILSLNSRRSLQEGVPTDMVRSRLPSISKSLKFAGNCIAAPVLT